MAIILFCACSVLTLALAYSAARIYQPVSAWPSETGSIIVSPQQAEDKQAADRQAADRQAEDMSARQNKNFRIASFACIALVFFAGVGATALMAGKALRPITRLSREIERIDENNLSISLPETKSHDEVAILSAAFNSMIGKLDKAFASQKRFSANAAHELKTPLAAMISRIEVCQLDKNPTAQEYRETLGDVLQNAERLAALVNDLLEIYDADFGLQRHGAFDMGEMLRDIVGEVSRSNAKAVTFDNRIAPRALAVTGNRDLLYRAFFNLVQNAARYNRPNGSVTLSSRAAEGKIQISVSDTGIGLPDDQLDKIFDPFYCVDKSRSRALGGSGLGLSLAKTIIEKHHGEISAKSEKGEAGASTTFTVTLPQ
jgi:signal transduction histidine kinase